MKDLVWRCRDGKEIEVKDMTEQHVKAVLRKLLRELQMPNWCREDNPIYYDEYWKD